MPNLRRHSTSHTTRPGSTNPEEGLVNGDIGETLDPDVAAEETRVGLPSAAATLHTHCHASHPSLQIAVVHHIQTA